MQSFESAALLRFQRHSDIPLVFLWWTGYVQRVDPAWGTKWLYDRLPAELRWELDIYPFDFEAISEFAHAIGPDPPILQNYKTPSDFVSTDPEMSPFV